VVEVVEIQTGYGTLAAFLIETIDVFAPYQKKC
jgi:hypothetical protein